MMWDRVLCHQQKIKKCKRRQALAEHTRLEQKDAERERALNKIKKIKDHLKEKMQQISLREDDIKKMDPDEIVPRETEELQKERSELQVKLKSQEKKVDYYERAKRLEEIPLLVANLKVKQLQDQQFWDQQETERIAAAMERELAVANQLRLTRMQFDKGAFLDKLAQERTIVYEDKLKEFEKHLLEERTKRLAERKRSRNEDRRETWIREKLEEAERKREGEKPRLEELARKEREEQDKIEKEEREKKIREQQKMLERFAAKERQREEEVERRLQEEREAKS